MEDNKFNFFKGKKVLITGASGFIGSNLAQVLSKIDCSLVLHCYPQIDRLNSLNSAQIEYESSDLSQKDSWLKILSDVDFVFHLASYDAKEHDPQKDLQANAISVLNLLETCRINQLRPKIIFASSSNLVGLPKVQPVDESYQDDPLTIYAIHKLTAEKYLEFYAREFGLESIVLRFTNVFGPGVSPEISNRVVLNKMIYQALEKNQLTLFKNFDKIRDFVYIDDVIKALLLSAINKASNSFEKFIIGSGQPYKIFEIVNIITERVNAITGKKPKTVKDLNQNLSLIEQRDLVADTSKFKKFCNWSAEYSLIEGINKTIEYFYINK